MVVDVVNDEFGRLEIDEILPKISVFSAAFSSRKLGIEHSDSTAIKY